MSEIHELAKEAKARAKEMGIVKPCSPIEDFVPDSPQEELYKHRDIFGTFTEICSKPAKKIFPYQTVPLQRGKVRDMTESDRKEFVWLHDYVECYLHSNVALAQEGAFSELTFCYNPTIWSNMEFWHIPHSTKISVPRHVILWINKTCTPCVLSCKALTPEQIASNMHQEHYSESGRYFKTKATRPQYYFTATPSPVARLAG